VSRETLLFIVSAPSGAGKTSLCREVINLVPDLHFSISCTTRPVRQHEKNGIDYYFLPYDEFMRMVEKDQLVEWTKIYGNYYGTAKATIEECRKNKRDVIFDIDHAGAQRIKKAYNNSITIFILPPSYSELEERLTQRGTDSEEVIRTRLNKAKNEIEQAGWYQYQIVNDNFNDALTRLKEIITSERLKKQL
jgi:guanylate kinase